jgi:very-short-patch-repair endonuclease
MPRDFSEKRAMRDSDGSRDEKLVRLAAQQHGVVAYRQLVALGFTPNALRHRVDRGWLYRVQPEVYAVVPSLKTPGRMMAAVLSCGPRAALSHRAAAAVWGLGPWPSGAVDVSATRNRGQRAGVRIHKVERVEAVIHEGFPVTQPMRTLSDLAATEPPPRVERAYEQADRLGLLDVARLYEECDGRRGSRVLKRLINEAREAPPSKNELERTLLDICTSQGIPLPRQNVGLHGFEVDAYWPDNNLVVELDGYEWHKTRAAFERDRERDAALASKGVRVLRFSWRQLTRQPEVVGEAIASSSTTPSRGSSAGGSSPPRAVPAISSSGDFSFGMKPDFMPK